ncbi:hypothetical protein AB0C69_33765 [Actinomadura sp. NPDC048032]|uniref:hypothetical protein n=1 Tax=Actinomadura sp. NPDC048032 TaxID=3155747 RepID=UPI0033DCF545
MFSVITGGRPPWFPLRAAAFRPSRVASRMFSRAVSAIAAKNANGDFLGEDLLARDASRGQGIELRL